MVLLTEIPQQSSSSTYDYDVFLSFRGIDTRYSFTDHLHKALLDVNIETFFDDTEIHIGNELKPELEDAIKASRASIIVLSKNYASSTWCLDELVLILEQRKNFNQIVIPVFYHVQPTHVKKQQNTFGDAMAKHKQRMDAETDAHKKSQWAQKIDKWEEALVVVADIKGKEAHGWRETILIEGIVKEMCRRLDVPKRSTIPKIIGMESSIRKITSFLKDGSTEILTIWGMPGIGKTCLAEYIFKLHYLDFERSSFLHDIERRWISPNGMLDLQKQLLKDIKNGSWEDIQNINAGTFKIAKSLLRKRTLLILDDVSRFEQLDVFIGTKGLLHPGSKIIITSKNESLTEKWLLHTQAHHLKHTKHTLKGLNDKDSLELLNWHSIKLEEPIKVVWYCQGHPLALKVLGSSLRNQDTTWEDILESLGKEFNPDIEKVLELSINSLPSKKDKDSFMHIACIFIGEDRDFTEEILKACGICNSSTIRNLSKRCLLRIDEDDKLHMHQLLQDVGRDMVYRESTKPWKRSLLWQHQDCFDVLQKGKGTSNIRGLIIDMNQSEDETSCGLSIADKGNSGDDDYNLNFKSPTILLHLLLTVIRWLLSLVYRFSSSFRRQKSSVFHTSTFDKMCNLKLLRLNYVQLNGSYKNLPDSLRWLCMHGFPLSYIPSDLPMENMVAIDMTNSNLRQFWKKPKQLLKSLKFLNLSSCRELVRVGSFSGFPSLERLILTGCTSLVEVYESIGNYCDKLEVLDLSECSKLKKLPRSIGKLKKLRELSLNGCSCLSEFPCEMKDMESLQVLEANNINKEYSQVSTTSSAVVKAIPESLVISLPSSLVRLSLINNNLSNESFPKSTFQGLSMLKTLELDNNNLITSLPDFVKDLNKLEFLSLTGCSRLTTVLSVPSSTQFLYTNSCKSLKRVTFSPETSTPPYIAYKQSESLSEIQGMLKVEDIAEVKEEILHSLGWINIKDVKDFQQKLTYEHRALKRRKLQMIYENGVFSTIFEGKELPYWICHRSKGSSISITIPSSSSSPNNCSRIQGVNICFLKTGLGFLPTLVISNLTKNCFWEYKPQIQVISKAAGDNDILWLCHWILGSNEFEDGNEVSIHFDDFYLRSGGIREFGFSLVYDIKDDISKLKEDEDSPLASYKSWQRIACQDLTNFDQRITWAPALEKW